VKGWWRDGVGGGVCRAGHARRALPVRTIAAFGLALVILTSQALRAPRATNAAALPIRHDRSLAIAPSVIPSGVEGQPRSRQIAAAPPDHFLSANAPWHFRFPRDHAAHDRFASEWWYFTGHVRAADGRRFGYELTFFRLGLRPGDARPTRGESQWRGNELYPAHFALTDEAGKTFVHYERFAREALGAGFASTKRLDVRDEGWTLTGPSPFRLHASVDGKGIDFSLTSEKPPAVHGHDGISKKGPCATCASHYYSMTRLRTAGTLTYGGARLAVSGISWMDHEFGSGELQANQVGWDWFSVQLDDRRELMLYLLRQKDGSVTPESSGSLIDARGHVTYLPRSAFVVTTTGSWKSPHTGGVYPSGWRVRVAAAGVDLVLAPVLADQELANTVGGVSYWEGAVDVRDGVSGHSLGVGYVELTGYAGAVSL
jgi:predicted secreted hydrolase